MMRWAWMKKLLASLILLGVWTVPVAAAPSVMVVAQDQGRVSREMERSLRNYLEDEGYDTRAGSTSQFVVIVNVIDALTTRGERYGVVGSVVIGSVDWVNIAESLRKPNCKKGAEAIQQVKQLLGVEFIFIDTTIATGRDAYEVAGLLGSFTSDRVREGTRKIKRLFKEVEKELYASDRGSRSYRDSDTWRR